MTADLQLHPHVVVSLNIYSLLAECFLKPSRGETDSLRRSLSCSPNPETHFCDNQRGNISFFASFSTFVFSSGVVLSYRRFRFRSCSSRSLAWSRSAAGVRHWTSNTKPWSSLFLFWKLNTSARQNLDGGLCRTADYIPHSEVSGSRIKQVGNKEPGCCRL